ncbi:hypothetical protein P7C70_g158, partial [Phenoliferia sp. Uapishka_3]
MSSTTSSIPRVAPPTLAAPGPPPVSDAPFSTTMPLAPASAPPTVATSSSAPTSPTIYVTYGERSVKARIDAQVPLSEIIRQLAASTQLGVSEPPALFALRGKEDGELITDDNLAKYLAKGQGFVLTSSPTIEAAEIVEKLSSGQPSILKLATYSLRTLVKEGAFLTEFLARGGLGALQDVIRKSGGNTLAYALLSMENLITEERGWEGLESDFVKRIVEIIATEPLINISRPAIAILRKLSHISPSSSPPADLSSSSSPPTPTRPSSLSTGSGFPIIYSEIHQQPEFLPIVVGRLSSGDIAVANLSLALINSLFRGAIELGDRRFGDEMEGLGSWEIVGTLLENQRSSGPSSDLQSILTFQSNLISGLHLSLNSRVEASHHELFERIWAASGLGDEIDWSKLGFKTEVPQNEFETTGVLGLKALANFALANSAEFAALTTSLLSRPSTHRCPLAPASSSIALSLASHFHIPEGASPSPTSPSPNLFHFYDLHSAATLFFVRIWNESGATKGDFARVEMLARSQIGESLRGEKAWKEVKMSFEKAEYKAVRDRQLKEMEVEDDLLSKASVRNLRGRLYRESYDFVRSQRIACLHEGAWFRSPSIAATSGRKNSVAQGQGKGWRFYRLAANRKVLHFVECGERMPIRGGLDDLPERIDLSTVTEIVSNGGPTLSKGHSRGFSNASSTRSPTFRSSSTLKSPVPSSPLSFSIHSNDGLIAELIAPNQSTYSEWIDGLALLKPDGSISTKETADFVHALTEIGVKIKLLDLSGERVEVPSGLVVPPVPRSTNFYYSDVI